MLGERLKKARENKNLSQADVAKELNISRQSISKWENNRVSPDVENLIRLGELYNITLDELVKELEVNVHDKKIRMNHRFESENEWIMLMILCVFATIVAPLGLVIAPLIMVRNKKNLMFHKLINVACIVCIFINIYHLYVIFGDYYHSEQIVEINKVD